MNSTSVVIRRVFGALRAAGLVGSHGGNGGGWWISRIDEGFAMAIVDEIEAPHFVRRRFTVAY